PWSGTGHPAAAAARSVGNEETSSSAPWRVELPARLVRFGLCVEHQPVGDVVLVDVADVRRRLDSDLPGDDDLDVVEPLVGVEAAPRRLLARAHDVAGTAVVAREREQRAVARAEVGVR